MEWGYFIILCLICSATGLDFQFKHDMNWLNWKQKHDRSYESDIYELEKYVTWVSNNALIEAHNDLGSNFGYTLGVNQFGDLVRTSLL